MGYTQEKSKQYVIKEDGNISALDIIATYKDGEYKGIQKKPILDEKDLDARGIALCSLTATPEFKSLVEAENSITGVGMEETISHQMEVLGDGQIQVRKAIRTFSDGVEIAKIYHRWVLVPDAKDISIEPERVKAVANAVWTDDVKAKFKEAVEDDKLGEMV